MCRRARLLLTIAFTSLFAVAVHAQLFDPNQDQPSTPFAQQVFSSAFPLECQVLQQFNPGISSCGVDTLIRNPTLLAWGLTTPVAPLITQTRYNPTSTQPLQNQFGPGATFFIFAHEAGHHFDLQFPNATVPWAATFPPIPPANPILMMSWNRELRADAWAGCAIKRAGMSLLAAAQLQQLTAMRIGADIPPFQSELAAISAGYGAC